MNHHITGHQGVADADFLELAYGTPVDLWLGVEGESEEERAARLDAARGILDEYPDLMDFVLRITIEAIEAQAPDLLGRVDGDR